MSHIIQMYEYCILPTLVSLPPWVFAVRMLSAAVGDCLCDRRTRGGRRSHEGIFCPHPAIKLQLHTSRLSSIPLFLSFLRNKRRKDKVSLSLGHNGHFPSEALPWPKRFVPGACFARSFCVFTRLFVFRLSQVYL